jgi:hypothetical protein
MNWFTRQPGGRRGGGSLPAMIEVLEDRTLLADGITPAAGAPINAVVGVPITNAIFATYTVSDPSGAPGTQWRAEIMFGDGQVSKQIVPVQAGSVFDLEATHTYTAPGTYTVTVMIAVPASHTPNDNTVTTQVNVTSPSPSPTPSPSPSPTPSPTSPPPSIGAFQSSGLNGRAKVGRTFHNPIARFTDPHSTASQFSTVIDWGDQTGPTPGQIKRQGKGRYEILGSHRYSAPGVFQVAITIRDAAGEVIAAHGSVTVAGK